MSLNAAVRPDACTARSCWDSLQLHCCLSKASIMLYHQADVVEVVFSQFVPDRTCFTFQILLSSKLDWHYSRVAAGAMKNVKMEYIPRWAMQLEERRWLNAIKQKAAAKVRFWQTMSCHDMYVHVA